MAKKTGTKSDTLALDIGSGSVGAAILSEASGAARLSAVAREPVGSGTDTSRAALTQATESALKKLLERYTKEHIRKVVVALAAPWHEAHIRTVSSASKQPARITEETVTRAIARYQSEKSPREGNVDVEAVAVGVEVNGYRTALARPVTGSTIGINLYESEMPTAVRQRFLSLIESAFPHADISFSTFPLIALIALRSLVPETSFAILDVAGEVTEVLIMHDDALHHIGSFPEGLYGIARGLAGEKDTTGDALSRLALFARGELSQAEESAFAERYAKAFSAWREGFDEVMKTAAEHTPIPRMVYLLSDREAAQWFTKGFAEQNTFDMDVTPVEAPLVQGAVELGEDGSYDVFLALAALFHRVGKTALPGDGYGEPA
ncbi:MAG: hypothetical protein ACE5F4_00935 [Candidatus Paceibacteria bacterium]